MDGPLGWKTPRRIRFSCTIISCDVSSVTRMFRRSQSRIFGWLVSLGSPIATVNPFGLINGALYFPYASVSLLPNVKTMPCLTRLSYTRFCWWLDEKPSKSRSGCPGISRIELNWKISFHIDFRAKAYLFFEFRIRNDLLLRHRVAHKATSNHYSTQKL